MKYPKHFSKVSRGFSFGESLLAAFVLSVGLVVVIQLFQKSITSSLFLRDATIASELAQEGVELVRNVRDNDFIAGGTGFRSFNSNRKHCAISLEYSLSCTSSQRSDSSYEVPSFTKFKRYVYIDYDSNPPEAIVRSFVFWGDATLPPSSGSTSNCNIRNKCVYTEVLLTNWKS